MGALFGTDGIRGVVNENLTAELAFRIGQAAATAFQKPEGKPVFFIGKDTRISSDMLEAALIAGICCCGGDAVRLNYVPTPAVAYLTTSSGADAGIVISASHNPYEHNGIKFFSREGFKLNDELEAKIESLILSEEPLPHKTHGELGRVTESLFLVENYIRHLVDTAGDLHDLRIVIDCANGAASYTAQRIFSRFNLDVTYLSDRPNGVNINDGCGSTHLARLQKQVKQGCYDLGIAFDGDADRCLAVDEQGNVIDGDHIMAICAKALREEGKLPHDGFVATVMSNLGLHKYAEENGLYMPCADVGDRNVLELMQKEGLVLGGEQSGHTIFLEHMTTGDGQLTALQFLRILCKTGLPASELAAEVTTYPQTLVNIAAPAEKSEKQRILNDPRLKEAIAAHEAALHGDGRILVRASGTEALIRVMVEAGSEQLARETAAAVAKVVENVKK